MKGAGKMPAVFGQVGDRPVHQVTIGRPDGLQAQVLTLGAVLRDLSLPLADGTRQSLTLGFPGLAPYAGQSAYIGAVVGRFANRIAGGQFALGGRVHALDRNEAGRTTLHGGGDGFHRRLWQLADLTETSVTLGLVSADGDQGFPGTLSATCTYAVLDGTALEVRFRATTDRPTPVNLAQHAYFNLDGGPDIAGHSLQIHADAFTPVNADQIPTGEVRAVTGTAVDFRDPRRLDPGQVLFDHNFVLSSRADAAGLRRAARLVSHRSGIGMTVSTTKPGLQFYDGHHLNLATPGLNGRAYRACAGLCLETQYFPDSPNQPDFPDCILVPGQAYDHRTLFSFDTGRGA